MSLINDALKRAQESQSQNPPPTLPPIPEPEPESKGPNWMLIGLVILLILNAVVFINLGVSHKKEKAKAQRMITEANRVAVVDVPSAPTQQMETAAPAVPVVIPPPATNTATNPAATVTNTIAPLKVQGIVFSKRPWAIVNGKMISVGDRVRDLKVTQINQYSVTFRGDDGSITKLNVGE